MSESATVAAAPERPSALAYMQIALGVALVTAAELLLKVGATKTSGAGSAVIAQDHNAFSGVTALASPWVWAGIICYIASLVNWLSVLRKVQLIVAFNLVNAVHVAVPLASWLLLKETVPWPRAVGIGLVVCGLLLLARSVAQAEEKL